MSLPDLPGLAPTPATVSEAIRRFAHEVRRNPTLANRLSQFRAWYADQDHDGRWHFGPSKFVGYEGLNGDTYLYLSMRGLHGSKTERHLQQWFRALEQSSEGAACLRPQLVAFLKGYGKAPHHRMRINVPKGRSTPLSA